MATLLAAGAAAVAFGGPASASAADGSTNFTYWSANHRAVVEGVFSLPQPGSTIYGLSFKLSDRDYRTASRGGKCAYLAINYQSIYGGVGRWQTDTYTQCGTDTDKQISSGILDLTYLRLKVCQIGQKSSHPVNCGRWHRIYTAPR